MCWQVCKSGKKNTHSDRLVVAACNTVFCGGLGFYEILVILGAVIDTNACCGPREGGTSYTIAIFTSA